MPIPFDLDLPSYLWTTYKVVFHSKGRLRQNTRPIPLRFEYEEIPDAALTPAQRQYFKPFDDQLAQMNFRPQFTFRATNFGSNLLRRYSSPDDAATCALTIVEAKATVNGVVSVRNACTVEFATRLADGRLFATFNRPLPTLLDDPPFRVTQNFPSITDIAELKRRHDLAGKTLGPSKIPPQTFDGVCDELNAEHARNAKFQFDQGNYQMAPGNTAYVVTDKVFDRGIRNHFWPFGRRVSVPRTILSALIGAVLPLVGILRLAPWLSAQALTGPQGGYSPLSGLAILLCYCLAGFLIGYVCEHQKFTWLMLVTYVPAHVVAGWTFGWFPYSTAAFVCAYFASQARRRAQLILQS